MSLHTRAAPLLCIIDTCCHCHAPLLLCATRMPLYAPPCRATPSAPDVFLLLLRYALHADAAATAALKDENEYLFTCCRHLMLMPRYYALR